MGIQQLLHKFSASRITIYRVPPGAKYRGGVFDPGVAKRITINASVQPVQSDYQDMTASTTGNLTRSTIAVKLFSDEEILLDNPTTQQRADRVEIDGVFFEARSQGKFKHFSLGHFETICVKVADK